MRLLIQNARIIDPFQNLDQGGDLLLEEGRIAQIGRGDFSGRRPGDRRQRPGGCSWAWWICTFTCGTLA